MRKISFIILAVILAVTSSFSQLGNEWIEDNAPYLKVMVVEDGFYRIDPADFEAQGIAVESIDPRSFRLIRRGEDWSINVAGQQDGQFNSTDFIKFYATANDALDEKELFLDSAFQFQEEYSFYTDTASYFLTWGGVSGKRVLQDISTTEAITNEVTSTFDTLFVDSYSMGNEPRSFIFNSEVDEGEGWMNGAVRSGNVKKETFLLNNAPSDGSGVLEVVLVGRNNNRHRAQLLIESTTGSSKLVDVDGFSEHETKTLLIDLSSGFLGDNISLSLTPLGVDGQTDFISFSKIKLSYGASTDLTTFTDVSQEFKLSTKTSTLVSVPSAGYDLYSYFKPSEMSLVRENASGSLLLNNNGNEEKTYLLYSSNLVKKPTFSVPNFSSYSSVPDYVIVSHPIIWDGAVDFQQFKRTTDGGGQDAQLFNVNNLYNTYTYGDRNPLAIRRLIKDLIRIDTPSVLLLFGRGLTPDYREDGRFFRKSGFNSSLFSKLDLVPTWGTPGSDLLFTANLGEEEVPLVPVGRYPVDESSDVEAIKEKILSHLNLSPVEDWRKNVIHLSGGKTEFEARVFANDVDRFKGVIEGQFFGGDVTTFTKKTDVPIEFFNISEQLNDGLSLITYIGHSSPDRIEIDLGNVSTDINGYRNKGRYPILYLNGCNAGDMYRSFTSGEDWLMTPDRGALGVFSHSSFGYSGQLARYTQVFYETAFSDPEFYGKTLGEIHQETIRRYRQATNSNPIDHTQMTQWVFFGDPSLRFFSPDREELSVKPGSIEIRNSLENERLTAKSDSVTVSFTLVNTGQASDELVKVCVSRVYDGLTERENYDTLFLRVPAVESFHELTVFNELEGSSGQNIFEVFVDCDNTILEYDETNNFSTTTINMPDNGVDLVFPYPYSILPNANVDFVIESQDLAQKPASTYLVQIANDFSYQDLLLDTMVLGSNFVSFNKLLPALANDTATFYWRSKLGETENEWSTSSFSIITDKTGWGQFQYGQFRENNLDNISLDDEAETFRFDSLAIDLKFETSGKNQGDFIFNTNIVLNERTVLNHLDHVGGCRAPGIVVLPFRARDLSTYLVNTAFNYTICGPDPKVAAHFNISNATLRRNLVGYLDSIPVGDFVILMATGDTKASDLDAELLRSLASFGNTSMASIPDGVPYVFIGEKGKQDVYYEKVILDDTQKITDSLTLNAISNYGQITASEVGFARNVSAVSWSVMQDSLETLLGELKQGNASVDSSEFNIDLALSDDLFSDESSYLSFSFDLTDSLNKSISQPNYWSVCYDPVPEGVISSSFLGNLVSVDQGDSVRLSIPFVNVSSTDFAGDLVATWSLTNLESGVSIQEEIQLGRLDANDQLFLIVALSTVDLPGRNKFSVQFNSTQLPEQNYTNNSLSFFLDVNSDKISPVTEVYINDVLASYDVVTGASPVIKSVLVDGNNFLVKNDTLGVELFFAGPCEGDNCDFSPLYFSDDRVSYLTENGSFVVNFEPVDLADGQYLFNVKGADAFGNQNDAFVETSFVVKEAKELSYFIPYPSPFSSSMRFAYTLYGDKQPDNIKVQILGPVGNLVREVTKQELGELKVGDNLTEWVWDGTDVNGKPLANGIYLYRVIIEDTEIEHLSTQADSYFKKGWGTIEISR